MRIYTLVDLSYSLERFACKAIGDIF